MFSIIQSHDNIQSFPWFDGILWMSRKWLLRYETVLPEWWNLQLCGAFCVHKLTHSWLIFSLCKWPFPQAKVVSHIRDPYSWTMRGETVAEKKTLCPLKWYNCLSIFSWILALPWSCDMFWFHSATLLECSNCLSSACILCIESCFAMLIWRGHSAVSFFQKESIRVSRYSIMLLVFRSTQTVCIKRNEYR